MSENGKVATDNEMVDLDLVDAEDVFPEPEKTSEKEDTPPVGTPAIEADTETETAPEGADTETETTEEPDLVELFKQQGLDERFSDPATMMTQQNRYITEKEQEAAQLRRDNEELQRQLRTQQPQRQETAELDQEKFLEDPVGILKNAGMMTRDEAAQMLDERDHQMAAQNSAQRAQAFRASKLDFESLAPAMNNLALKFPGISSMPVDEAVELLYETVSRGKKTVVQPADPSKRDRARTDGGTTSGNKGKKDDDSEDPTAFRQGESTENYEKRVGFGEN